MAGIPKKIPTNGEKSMVESMKSGDSSTSNPSKNTPNLCDRLRDLRLAS